MKLEGEVMNVLMVGNNPLELVQVLNHLRNIKGKKVVAEIAFDLKSCLHRLSKFTPNFILIDDNLGRTGLAEASHLFSRFRKTKDIPVTVLKNSNYTEAFGGIAMNYILKENVNERSLRIAFRSSLISMQAQSYLKSAYKRRRRRLKRFLPV